MSATRVVFADKAAIAAELRCHLCKEPWWADAAKACPECEEIYCRSCIEDHLLKAAGCPACSAALDVASMRAPPRQLRSMSERNVIVCCPFKRGCWQGPWGELAAHVKACTADPARITYAGDVDTDLHCEICMEPAREPVLAPCCEQLFCHVCILKVLQREGAECPHCRSADVSEDLLQEAPKKLVSMLDKLPVLCSARCGWEGPRVELSGHVSKCDSANPVDAPTPAPAAPAPVPTLPANAAVAPPPATAAPAAAAASGDGKMRLTAKTFHPWVRAAPEVEKFTAMAHIVAPAPTAAMAAKRKNLHISAVMDVSGSMRGEKLRLAKESLRFVVDELQPADKFGLIAFDDRIEEICPTIAMSDAGKSTAAARISALKDRGSTNLSGGLFAGIAQARDLPFNGGVATTRDANTTAATRRYADPHMATRKPTSFMGRMLNSVGLGAAVPPPPPPTAMPAAAAPAIVLPPAVPRETPVAAFNLVLGFNASPVKQNGTWRARYAFELAAGHALPAGVSHVCVIHPTGGRLTIRGRSTFGLLPEQKANFLVEVYRDGSTEPHAVFAMAVDAEEGAGTCTFAVPAYTPAPAAPPAARADHARIVMLFTDGVANSGITDPSTLTARTREILAAVPDKDVTVFTFGFGSNHNASLLQQIAEISQGTYYYVERTAQLKEIFADCIGGLLSMVASNIKLTVRPTLGVRIGRVMTQFPQEAAGDGSVVVSIKDMYAEEARDVLVELEVAPRGVGAAAPVVAFDLAADNVVLGAAQSESVVAAVPTKAEAFEGTPDEEVDQQLSRFVAAEAMTQAQQLADAGEVEAANLRLRNARAQVMCSAAAGTGYGQQLSRDLDEAEAATRSAGVWASHGQKRVSKMKATHAMQRANYGDDEDMVFDAYSTSAKVAARAKAKR